MESAPDDILTTIFTIYTSVEHLNLSPTGLLGINKRIHNLVLSTPTLWSSFRLNIRSLSNIHKLLEGGSIELYLQQSEGPGLDVDLDIDVVWHPATSRSDDHMLSCDVSPLEVFSCPMMNCQLIPTRQAALIRLFHILMGASSKTGVLNRYGRWKSLQLDLRGITDGDRQSGGSLSIPFPRAGFTYEAARLNRIVLTDSFITFLPITATNLRHLELRRACFLPDLNLQTVETFGYIPYSAYSRSRTSFTTTQFPRLTTLNLLPYSPLSLLELSDCLTLHTIAIHCTRVMPTTTSIFREFKPRRRSIETLVLLNATPSQLCGLLVDTADWHFVRLKFVRQSTCWKADKRASDTTDVIAPSEALSRKLLLETMEKWKGRVAEIDTTEDPYLHQLLALSSNS
ncbi:hypothetical protein FRC17_011045 [Serendipita sp. 399]|nr:hypothetical protein FRC17_011045 [Serendipita sp. 399]